MTNDSEKAEELLQQSSENTRTTSGASGPDLAKKVADELQAIEDGKKSSNLATRDDRLAALVRALDECDQLGDVQTAAADAVDRDAEQTSASRALALLARVGLSEVVDDDDDVLEQWRDGYRQHLDAKADKV